VPTQTEVIEAQAEVKQSGKNRIYCSWCGLATRKSGVQLSGYMLPVSSLFAVLRNGFPLLFLLGTYACSELKTDPRDHYHDRMDRKRSIPHVQLQCSCVLLLLPPQHAEELLYDPDCCLCGLEWRCIPHDVCFIHDSCLCKGSGSFPPVKPQRPSWADFSYDWYCEFAPSLALHPHSLLPHFGSEVEPDVLIFGLSNPRS